jgi:predicted SnoaL-like aldol condensation-catalyzing enzyme
LDSSAFQERAQQFDCRRWTLEEVVSLTETNREMVHRFVDLFYRQKDVRKAFTTFVAKDYVQHNPNIPDGREAAIGFLEPMFSRPEARFDVKRILVDGNFAAVHLHGRPNQQEPGAAVVDMFRIANGLIVEHWDVLQPIPKQAINPHPMF